MSNLLSLDNLRVEFYPDSNKRNFDAVKSVSIDIAAGETLGVVGESGCGKSLTALTLLDLQPPSSRAHGSIVFDNTKYRPGTSDIHDLRGNRISMIFQEPMSALNPVFSIGEQLRETLKYVTDVPAERRRTRAIRLLQRVYLQRPEQRLEQYPHELSGGQRQRVMIALALAGKPDLLIADEPTTALDVTIESQIMTLFSELADDGLSILLISHDLPLVAGVSDRISVMYSGYTVETGPADTIATDPQHPYTEGLIRSSAGLEKPEMERLPVIEGDVPKPSARPSGCPFHPRCPEKESRCERDFPPVFETVDNTKTACWAREN